jgi:hypothetical protein
MRLYKFLFSWLCLLIACLEEKMIVCTTIFSISKSAVKYYPICRWARSACDQSFYRCRLLTNKLILQGFLYYRLLSGYCIFYDHYSDIDCQYNSPFVQMPSDVFHINCYATISRLPVSVGSNPARNYLVYTKTCHFTYGRCAGWSSPKYIV